jgi:hypothetical protein
VTFLHGVRKDLPSEVGGNVGGDGDGDDDQPLMTQVETLDLEEAMDMSTTRAKP